MEQEKINYSEIMALGFSEEVSNDRVYYNEHGYDYSIITLNLTECIYLDWEKETKLCKMVRIDNTNECNIMKTLPIMNLYQLKEIINFFSDTKE